MLRLPFWAGWTALIAGTAIVYLVMNPTLWSSTGQRAGHFCWRNASDCSDFRTRAQAQEGLSGLRRDRERRPPPRPRPGWPGLRAATLISRSQRAPSAPPLGFLVRPATLPPVPGGEAWGWPASSVHLEAVVRFPWTGGRHPCLDALIETRAALVGVESKRYEPFRTKPPVSLSNAYWRPVWGGAMTGYERVRDSLREATSPFARLDAAQLVKHAFGLRTAVHREQRFVGKQPVLLYLYTEPERWPDGRPVPSAEIDAHRAEIRDFAEVVTGDEVAFHACSYRELLSAWSGGSNDVVRAHAAAITARFGV